MKNKFNFLNFLLSIFSLIFISLFVEMIYSIAFQSTSVQFYNYPPNLKFFFLPSPKIFPGVKDTSFFTTNRFGFRGPELNLNSKNTLLALGGSTTECVYLDDKETWPFLLEKKLNSKIGNSEFQVINGGKSGINSNHHIKQLDYFLKNDFIKGVIILEGINDLQYALSLGKNYSKKSDLKYIRETFSIIPSSYKLWYKNLLLYQIYRKVKTKYFGNEPIIDKDGTNYLRWRDNRNNATQIINELPDITLPLNDYKNNLIEQISLAKHYNKLIIFMTQPVLWKKNLSYKLKRLCWFGWIGKDQNFNSTKYYSIQVLETLMDEFNKTLKEVCKSKKILFIDLASVLSKDTTVFFDDCHFNETGSRKVAEIVYQIVKKK